MIMQIMISTAPIVVQHNNEKKVYIFITFYWLIEITSEWFYHGTLMEYTKQVQWYFYGALKCFDDTVTVNI